MEKEKVAEEKCFEMTTSLSPFDELVCKEILKYIHANSQQLTAWLKEKLQYFTEEKLEEIKNNLEKMGVIEGRRYFFEQSWWIGLELYQARRDENHEFNLILNALRSNKTENLVDLISRFLNRLNEDNPGFWLVLSGYLHKFNMQVCTNLVLTQDYEMLRHADKQLLVYASVDAVKINPEISDWSYTSKIWSEEIKNEVSQAVAIINHLTYKKLNSLSVQNVIRAALYWYENTLNSTKKSKSRDKKSNQEDLHLTRKSIRTQYLKISKSQWLTIFKNEKRNGLVNHRVQSRNSSRHACYSKNGIEKWLLETGNGGYTQQDFIPTVKKSEKKDLKDSYAQYKNT